MFEETSDTESRRERFMPVSVHRFVFLGHAHVVRAKLFILVKFADLCRFRCRYRCFDHYNAKREIVNI